MPLFLCCALLSAPTSTSRLLSVTASVEQAALSSLSVFLSCVCFAAIRVLRPVWIWIGHDDEGRVVFHHFSHSSVKGVVVWLVLGQNLSGLFSQNFIKRFPSAMRSCLPLQSRDWLHRSGLCNTGLWFDLAGRQKWLRVRWQWISSQR